MIGLAKKLTATILSLALVFNSTGLDSAAVQADAGHQAKEMEYRIATASDAISDDLRNEDMEGFYYYPEENEDGGEVLDPDDPELSEEYVPEGSEEYAGSGKTARTTKDISGTVSGKRKKLQGSQTLRDGDTPPAQEPVSGDGVTIEKLTVRWVSRSTGETAPARFDRLRLVPETDLLPNMQFQIDFALSGKQSHDPGAVRLTFPAYILRDRTGKEAGELTLSLPEEGSGHGDFVWRREGDSILVTNARKISAASKVMFQGTYRYTIGGEPVTCAHEIRDIDTKDQEGSGQGQSGSGQGQDGSGSGGEEPGANYGVTDPLQAGLELLTPSGQTLAMESNVIDASVDTYVEADTLVKKGEAWWNAEDAPLPESLLPENPDSYCYARWYVSGSMTGCQPARVMLTDRLKDAVKGTILGLEKDGEVIAASGSGRSMEVALFEGFRETPKAVWIWTAYPKPEIAGAGKCILSNEVSLSVTGTDDGVETTRTAEAQVALQTPVTYTFEKKWLDQDNVHGVRPGWMWLKIWKAASDNTPRRLWRKVKITPDAEGKWLYSWSDKGRGDTYEVEEELENAHGSYEPVYDSAGHMRKVSWGYLLDTKEYDEQAHKWTFGNKYTAGWIALPVTRFSKAALDHKDYRRNSRADRDLSRLLAGETAELSFEMHTAAAPAVWTLHDSRPVTVCMTEEGPQFGGTDLTEEDMDIRWVELSNAAEYAYVNFNEETATYEKQLTQAPPEFYLEGRSDVEWIRFAVLDSSGRLTAENGAVLQEGRLQFPDNVTAFRCTTETNEAILEFDCKIGFRLKPSARVQQIIREELEENAYGMLRFDNNAKLLLDREGEQLTVKNAQAAAYLHGRLSRVAARQTKAFSMVENDIEKKQVRLRVSSEVILQSTLEEEEDYRAAIADGIIPQTLGGTFYDLLPAGVEPDLTTVILGGGGTVRSSYVIENYRGSGRTMAVISADLPEQLEYRAEGTGNDGIGNEGDQSPYTGGAFYPQSGLRDVKTISFDCAFSYEEATESSFSSMYNVIAFEADGHWIGNVPGYSGEKDDASGECHCETRSMLRLDAPLMKNLDPLQDDPSFIYAGAYLAADELDLAAEMELRKYVMVGGDGDWISGLGGQQAVVSEGGKYAYRITFQAATDTVSRDVILLDALENYVPAEWDEDNGSRRWKGVFRGLNLSDLVKEGIEPVVYYSTVPDPDLSGLNPGHEEGVVREFLLHSPDWKRMEADRIENWTGGPGEGRDPESGGEESPGESERVTAIAIDCGKRPDGTDFQLEAGKLLSVYIYMTAPEGEEALEAFAEDGYEDPEKNAHAFNQVYLDSTELNERGQAHSYVHYDYTKVGIAAYDLTVHKIWQDEEDRDGKRPEKAIVHLYDKNGDTGRFLELTAAKPNGIFSHVRRFDEEGRELEYRFIEDPSEGYSPSVKREGNDVWLTNTHIPEKRSIRVEKQWEDDLLENGQPARPDSVTVRLYADGVFTGYTRTLRADEDGRWQTVFTDLPRYRDRGTEILYTVEEDPVEDFVTTVEYKTAMTAAGSPADGPASEGTPAKDNPAQDDIRIINRYYPYGNLRVSKKTEHATTAALEKSFHFTLLLKDREGNDLTGKYEFCRYRGPSEAAGTGRIGSGEDFELKSNESLVVQDLPSGTQYEVRETRAPGFILTEARDSSGVIRAGLESRAEFTNTYHSRGQADLAARKTLSGKMQEDYQFRFTLLGEDGAERMNTSRADGSIRFGTLRFTEADDGITHRYTIREVKEDKPGYTYDDAAFTAEVTPRDRGDGTMTAEVRYLDDTGNEIPVPVFHNSYHASGEYTFLAWKQLEGGQPADRQFSFGLYDEDGREAAFGQNRADGSIVFSPVSFDESDTGHTYTFTAREKPGEDPAIEYDGSEFRYLLTVHDHGDGTLDFEEKTDEDKMPVFRNRFKEGSVAVSKLAEQEGGTGDLPEQEFRFRLKLLGTVPAENISWSIGPAGNTDIESPDEESPDEAAKSEGTIIELSNEEFPEIRGGGGRSSMAESVPLRASSFSWDNYPEADAAVTKSGTKDSCSWELYSDGTLVLRPTSGSSGTLTSRPADWDAEVETGTKRVKITDTVHLAGRNGAAGLFNNFKNTTRIRTEGLEISQVTRITYMFNNCNSLETVDVSHFDTSNCTDMFNMFNNCYALTAVDVSHFKTGKAGNVNSMFKGCRQLASLDVSSWDTGNMTNMWSMFCECRKLETLDVSNWNTSNVTEMGNLFRGCDVLEEIDVSSWDISKVASMNAMFYGCRKVKEFDLGAWNTASLTDMGSMFRDCFAVRSLDLGNFQTDKVSEFSYMFNNCPLLAKLDLDGWDTRAGTNMQNMFSGDNALKEVVLGPEFSFRGNGSISRPALLPAPPAEASGAAYTGKWIREDGAAGPYTNAELRDQYTPAMAGLWIWEEAPVKYTVTYEAGETGQGPVAGGMPPSLFDSNKDAVLPANGFYCWGYRFREWIDKDNPAYTYENRGVIPAGRYAPESAIILQASFESRNEEILFEDGEAEFVLAPGERIVFSGIPAGTAYQVWEETPAGWILTESRNESGIVVPLETAEAVFTNAWHPEITEAGIRGIKYMDGLPAAEGSFSFELLENDVRLQEVQTREGGAILFEPIRYAGPGTHVYSIRETSGDGTANGRIEYDTHVETVRVTVRENEGGILSTEVVYDGDGIIFRNSSRPGTLELHKRAEGQVPENADDRFSFEISFTNSDGTPMDGSGLHWYKKEDPMAMRLLSDIKHGVGQLVENIKTAIGSGAAETAEAAEAAGTGRADDDKSPHEPGQQLELSLMAGETAVIPDLPAGTRYEILEKDLPPGWEQSDAAGLNGTIEAAGTAYAEAVNSYHASGSAWIGAGKILSGRKPEGGEFIFRLYHNGEMIDECTNDSFPLREDDPDEYSPALHPDGAEDAEDPDETAAPVVFRELFFTEPGTYTYTIREAEGSDPQIIYDTHEELVTVEVRHKGKGVLSADVHYDEDGAIFRNTVRPGSLLIKKEVRNASAGAAAGPFTFRIHLTDAGGISLQGMDPMTVHLSAGEEKEIGGLPHGTRYRIEEILPEGWTLTASSGTEGVIQGGKTAEPAYFENTYSTAGTLELTGRKYLEGGIIPDGHTFRFLLFDERGEMLQSAFADENGVFSFHIDYEKEDDGRSFLYYIREEDPGEDYITDSHEEMIRVAVRDNGHGQLTAEAEYDEDGLIFRNTACYDLTVSKQVERPGLAENAETGTAGEPSGDADEAAGETSETAAGETAEDRTFSFELVLTGRDSAQIPAELKVQTGEKIEIRPLADGRLRFALRDGENIVFHNIPSFLEYTVRECTGGYQTEIRRKSDATTVYKREMSGKLTENDELGFINRTRLIIIHKEFLQEYVPFGTGTALIRLQGSTAGGEQIGRYGMLQGPEDTLVFEVPDGRYEISEVETARYYIREIRPQTQNVTVLEDGSVQAVLRGDNAELTIINDFQQYEKLSHNDSVINHIG